MKQKKKSKYGLAYVQDKEFSFKEKRSTINKILKYDKKLVEFDNKSLRALNSAIKAINEHKKYSGTGKKDKLKSSRQKLDRAFNKLLKYEYTDEWGHKKSFVASKTIEGKKYYSTFRKIGSVEKEFKPTIYDYESFKEQMDIKSQNKKTRSRIQQIIDFRDSFLFGGYHDWVDRVRKDVGLDDSVSPAQFEKWIEKYVKENS